MNQAACFSRWGVYRVQTYTNIPCVCTWAYVGTRLVCACFGHACECVRACVSCPAMCRSTCSTSLHFIILCVLQVRCCAQPTSLSVGSLPSFFVNSWAAFDARLVSFCTYLSIDMYEGCTLKRGRRKKRSACEYERWFNVKMQGRAV